MNLIFGGLVCLCLIFFKVKYTFESEIFSEKTQHLYFESMRVCLLLQLNSNIISNLIISIIQYDGILYFFNIDHQFYVDL
ncbi:hypothetical protein pb186bvf_001551 [Paramecium bursaria]